MQMFCQRISGGLGCDTESMPAHACWTVCGCHRRFILADRSKRKKLEMENFGNTPLMNAAAGETDEECFHEPVPLWNFLRVRETERAGEPQHHLDCRVRLAATPREDRQLHSHFLKSFAVVVVVGVCVRVIYRCQALIVYSIKLVSGVKWQISVVINTIRYNLF